MLFGTNLLAQSLLKKWSHAQVTTEWGGALKRSGNNIAELTETDKTLTAQFQFDSKVFNKPEGRTFLACVIILCYNISWKWESIYFSVSGLLGRFLILKSFPWHLTALWIAPWIHGRSVRFGDRNGACDPNLRQWPCQWLILHSSALAVLFLHSRTGKEAHEVKGTIASESCLCLL